MLWKVKLGLLKFFIKLAVLMIVVRCGEVFN